MNVWILYNADKLKKRMDGVCVIEIKSFAFFPTDLLSRIDLDELMKKDEPPFTFPKTLEEFEYAFNECECIDLLFRTKAKSVMMSSTV